MPIASTIFGCSPRMFASITASLPGLEDAVLHVLADRLLDDLLDPRRVHAAVGDEPLERLARDRPADRIEARHAITPGVSSTRTSTPVAFSIARMLRPSRPDDAALHVVRGDADRPDGGVGHVLGRVPLDRLDA